MQLLLINATTDFADPKALIRDLRCAMLATRCRPPLFGFHAAHACTQRKRPFEHLRAGYRKLQASSLCSQISQATRLPLQSINYQLSTIYQRSTV